MSTTANVSTTVSGRRRGCLFYVKRAVKWLVLILVVVILGGVVFQLVSAESDRRNYPASGQMVQVNGRQLHIRCTGEGSPTVILEAGAFSFSTEWYWVQRQLEPTNRVCSYDRAGNGWSEVVTGDRDGLTLVHELHTLLTEADVPGPYVMVGHSLGGVLSVLYASQYPDETLGLVLADSAMPRQWTDYNQFEEYLTQFPSPYTVMTMLTQVGVIRLILSPELQDYGYPADVTAQLTAFKSTPQGVNTWNAEAREAQWDLSQQFQVVSDLGNLPVVVMWASRPELSAPADRELLEGIWAQMPTLSSNQVIRMVEGANHGSIIGNEQYAQLVTSATHDVIEAAQTDEPLEE